MVGHLALGYLAGKAASKYLNVDVNISLLFFLSIIPDIDLLIPYVIHRGPTHSITFLLLFLPAFIFYMNKMIPYLITILTHSVIGDYLTDEGIQIFWPVTVKWFGIGIPASSPTNVFIELILFITFLAVIYRTKDILTLIQKKRSNFLLFIPICTVLLPAVFSFPLYVPAALFIPHLTFLSLFTVAIVIYLWKSSITNTRNKIDIHNG